MGEAAEGNLASLAIFVVIIVAIFGVVYFALSMSVTKIMTTKKGEKKATYVKKEMVNSGIDAALLRKEFKRLTSSVNYIMNCGLGAIFMLFAGVALIYKASDIKEVVDMYAAVFGDKITEILPLLAIAAIGTMASMCDISAPSVSLEGNTLWILKSLPIDPIKPLMAKLKLNIYVAIVPAFFVAVCGIIVFDFDFYYSAMIILAAIVFVIFYSLLGLVANLKFPNLEWTNEIVPIKQGMSVIITMLGGMCFVFLLGGLYYLLWDYVTPRLYAALVLVFVAIMDYLMYLWIKKRGARIFANL